jgi:hypothetical protein
MNRLFDATITRRKLLTNTALLGAGALTLANTQCDAAIVRRLQQAEARRDARHAVWVWQFSEDGTADEIASALAAQRLAAIVKTHDGTEWMANFDHVPGAIDGPAQAATVAVCFRRVRGAWCWTWRTTRGSGRARGRRRSRSARRCVRGIQRRGSTSRSTRGRG